MNDAAIASFNQNIGYRLAQFQALRNGKKMLLALRGCILDQIGVA